MSAQDSLADRLKFIGLDDRSRAALRGMRPIIARSIGPALTAFYDKVRATPETRRFFRDEKHMSAAKGRQELHWGAIASGEFNESYVTAVRAIGQAHARLGLEPRWYIGGYALILEQLIRAIVKDRWPRLLRSSNTGADGMAEALSSLAKAIMLDMDLAISIYLETLDAERQRAEEARLAAQRSQTAALQLLASALHRLADGDLTARMEGDVAAEFEPLKADFNASIEKLREALLAVSSNAHAIWSGAQEIATAADDLSRRTEQQAASLEETAAALDQVTVTVKKTADGVDHARQAMAAAKVDAEKSETVVRQTNEAMNGIETSSKQIGQIIGVIDEIAFQTNLLALNAGVEAARAGDAGRGFAVVASEVRSLAQRSAEAAKDIKKLITASMHHVDEGVSLVAETGESLRRIVAQVSNINGVVAEIAASASEQSSSLHQINTAVNQMDQMTQQNAAMVEQSTAASHSLRQETSEMTRLIERFKLAQEQDVDPILRELQRAAPHAFAQTPKPAAPNRQANRA